MTQSARPTGRLLLLAVLLIALAGVAVALFWPGPKHRAAAAPPPPPSSAPPSPSPSPSPTKQVPYPWFPVGTCLDHPQLSPVITVAQARPCDGPHDAEVIANPLLPDGLVKDSQIATALRTLCQPFVATAQAAQGGGTWYSFPMGPALKYYQQGSRDTSCLLTASEREGGTKLTAPLKH
ncbi:hypothetical protein [Kitasatospora viridis]|uniref:Regulator of septum formation n=1 Tax=Kitasatospora viridis TaxID=281105 RepID=A0A561UMD7_9ACTN|nr:hypothetical protein [Kitasatospora viridis]TWG00519.1 hypothetical protein FHX73_114398 [Kitasatospora viridis]